MLWCLNNLQGPVPLICLIPELCYSTGMDSSITSNYEIMKDVALFTKLTPHQRNLAIQKFVQNINGMFATTIQRYEIHC